MFPIIPLQTPKQDLTAYSNKVVVQSNFPRIGMLVLAGACVLFSLIALTPLCTVSTVCIALLLFIFDTI